MSTLKEENYKLLSSKFSTLLASALADLANQLDKIMVDMTLKYTKLIYIKEDLRKHKEELKYLKQVGQKIYVVVLDLQNTRDKIQKEI